MFKKILNILFFQCTWWGLLTMITYQFSEAYMVLLCCSYLVVHFSLISNEKGRELIFVLLASAIGITMDLGLWKFEVISYYGYGMPIWSFLVWPVFATTISHSMSSMKGKYILSFLFGLIGAPVTYLSLEKMNVLSYSLNDKWYYVGIHGFLWGMLMVTLFLLQKKILKNALQGVFACEGKNFFVTGGNRGIGFALALEAAKKKMNVYLLVRKPMKEVEEQLRAAGAPLVTSGALDLSKIDYLDNFEALLEKWNVDIDVFVNNSGVLTGGLLEEQSPSEISNVVQVNLTATMGLTRNILPGMLKRDSGIIVNNASTSGEMTLPGATTYAATKFGVVGFTRSLMQELSGTHVRALLLMTPGVKTRMYDQIYDKYSKNMDLSFLSSITPEDWAKRVFESIETGQDECRPRGATGLALRLNRMAPLLFNSYITSYFSREPKS